MPEDKIPPFTVKGIPKPDREAMGAAARRCQETMGQWIIEAGRQRIARERVSVLPAASTAPNGHADGTRSPAACEPTVADTSGAPSLRDLVAIVRELRDVPRCGQVVARARRLLSLRLGAHLPPRPEPPRGFALPRSSAATSGEG